MGTSQQPMTFGRFLPLFDFVKLGGNRKLLECHSEIIQQLQYDPDPVTAASSKAIPVCFSRYLTVDWTAVIVFANGIILQITRLG